MERLKRMVQVNVILGVWLIIAPFVLGYSGSTVEVATDVAVGAWFVACAWWVLAADSGRLAAETLELLGAICLVAAPFVWHYHRMSRPFGNDLAVGILSVIVSAAAISMLSSRLRSAA